MGIINERIILRNPKDESLKEMPVDAVVDTGALHLCIPEKVAVQLNLKELYKRSVVTADGKQHVRM